MKHKLKIGIVGTIVGATALTLLLGGGDFSSKMSNEIKGKYTISGEKLTMVAKADPKDKITVEVGDTTFKPKLKISRWDEVSLSLTLKDDDTGTKTISSVGDKIVYDMGDKKVEYYDLPVSAENPEGGYETEVILKSKPKTNVIEFTLIDEDVEYFYQPELTAEEITQGASRPENVVGSYAVYAKTPKTNWTGGKEYKVGKVGHIFRPKIIDSAGTEVWGDLHIENGILSVTIPQDFLDKAVYPVIVDPTFGYNGIGGSNASHTAPRIRGTKYALSENGTVSSISVYIKANSGGSAQYAVYDTSANPVRKGYTGNVAITSTVDWRSGNIISGGNLTTNNYFLLLMTEQEPYLWWDATGGTGNALFKSGITFGTWSDPISSPTLLDNYKFSIYATYTASGGEAAAPAPIDDFLIIQPE